MMDWLFDKFVSSTVSGADIFAFAEMPPIVFGAFNSTLISKLELFGKEEITAESKLSAVKLKSSNGMMDAPPEALILS